MIYETYCNQLMRCPSGVEMEDHKKKVESWVRYELMGGRLIMSMTASAPTSPEVVDFLRETCEAPVHDMYGSTEIGGITMDCKVMDSITEWKLEDVPDLGYTSNDKPYARGELLVKSIQGIQSYYKDQGATDLLIDKDGFYHTGDIMEHRGDDILVWIDRRKNVVKLAQGEYVSVSRLEALFTSSPAIHQIYIYGNSSRSYLLAVVVPATFAKDEERKEEEQLSDRALIRQELDRLGAEGCLQGYEIPRDFIVEYEPFSRDNHLLTDRYVLAIVVVVVVDKSELP